MKRKLVTVLTIISLALLMFSGCEVKKEPTKSVPTITPTKSVGKLEGNIYTTGYPIVKDKITLKVMIQKEVGNGDFNKMKFTTDYEAKTNVKIEWLVVDSSAVSEATQAMFNSGNYPDIYSMPLVITESDVEQYGVKEKQIANISPLIEKWAPNLYKAINKDNNVKKSLIRSDGNIYTIPQIGKEQQIGYVIRKSWLDNLGLKVPVTTDDFFNMLKAFKNNDPNGNGQKDEIPLAFNTWIPMQLFAPWGLEMDWGDYTSIDKNQKMNFAPITPQYKSAIEYWKKVFKEDLVDKTLINGTNRIAEVAKEGKIGAIYWPLLELIDDAKIAGDYIPIAMPKAPNTGNFQSGIAHFGTGLRPTHAFISANCKNKEAALRWLDFFYTPEGQIYRDYGGEPGKYYEQIGDKFRINKKALVSGRYPMNDTPAYMLPSNDRYDFDFIYKPAQSQMTPMEKVMDNYNKLKVETDKIDKPMFSKLYLTYKPESKDKINELDKALANSFWWATNAIQGNNTTGMIDPLTNWNGFVAEFKRLGCDDLVKLQQAAWDNSK